MNPSRTSCAGLGHLLAPFTNSIMAAMAVLKRSPSVSSVTCRPGSQPQQRQQNNINQQMHHRLVRPVGCLTAQGCNLCMSAFDCRTH